MKEGVVQYTCELTAASAAWESQARDLCRWREELFVRDAIGCRPERGYGACYGNVSVRCGQFAQAPGRREFLVSCTQSGGLASAGPDSLARVLRYDHQHNHVVAQGPCPPSSETMTHGAIYDADLDIRAVVHGHDPVLWSFLLSEGAPHTPANVDYGTPEMARWARQLVRQSRITPWRYPGILAMAGHQDGVVAWGQSPKQATERFLLAWSAARPGA